MFKQTAGSMIYLVKHHCWVWLLVALFFSCGGGSGGSTESETCPAWTNYTGPVTTTPVSYTLDENAAGVYETVNNIANLTVVSKDANVFRAEYRAGFIQGKLQQHGILATRDNCFDRYCHGPSSSEVRSDGAILNSNFNYLIRYIQTTKDAQAAQGLTRLLFRMLGIYHGTALDLPADLDFSGTWLPDSSYFQPSELVLSYYGTSSLTFMDVYFINACIDLMVYNDFQYNISSMNFGGGECSAFLKRIDGDVIFTQTLWTGYQIQTMATTLFVNNDLLTFNAHFPGAIGSLTDFGYNNKGIMFNSTMHDFTYTEMSKNSLWVCWRAALAEQFSASLDDFFHYISIENSGTYLNGYMLVDANTNETGLVEMSYRAFVFYRSSGGPYTVSTKPAGLSTAYDPDMVTPDYIMAYNYPASYLVRHDLQAIEGRPAARRQFKQLLPGVNDVESAKAVITYIDPNNPMSIFGRFDLGYGETNYPVIGPRGAIDAKVATASMARSLQTLSGELDITSPAKGFWMLYGTPHVKGRPFVWSCSRWRDQTLRDIPDVIDGSFTYLNLNLR